MTDPTRTQCHDRGCVFRLAELVAPDLVPDLMHMGDIAAEAPSTTNPAGKPAIRLFKHCDTRRYLNLAAEGEQITAWRYVGGPTVNDAGTYERIDLAAALHHVTH